MIAELPKARVQQICCAFASAPNRFVMGVALRLDR